MVRHYVPDKGIVRMMLPAQTPWAARTSVMDVLAKRPFIAPIGQRYLHQSLLSKIAEQTMAPIVMRISSQPDSAAEFGRSQTSSQTRIPAKSASMNHPPNLSTAPVENYGAYCRLLDNLGEQNCNGRYEFQSGVGNILLQNKCEDMWATVVLDNVSCWTGRKSLCRHLIFGSREWSFTGIYLKHVAISSIKHLERAAISVRALRKSWKDRLHTICAPGKDREERFRATNMPRRSWAQNCGACLAAQTRGLQQAMDRYMQWTYRKGSSICTVQNLNIGKICICIFHACQICELNSSLLKSFLWANLSSVSILRHLFPSW